MIPINPVITRVYRICTNNIELSNAIFNCIFGKFSSIYQSCVRRCVPVCVGMCVGVGMGVCGCVPAGVGMCARPGSQVRPPARRGLIPAYFYKSKGWGTVGTTCYELLC